MVELSGTFFSDQDTELNQDTSERSKKLLLLV